MEHAKVAVITRTRDRALFLRRAVQSVSAQTYRDFIWIVVNDGGAPEEVEAVVAHADVPQIKILHRRESRGMEAASNAGIQSCDSAYLVIHDDDDTWNPDFLKKTVAFLDGEPLFNGVVTHSIRVNETIRDGVITETSRSDFNAWLHSIYIMEMMLNNTFPPISFLYRRSACTLIGGYDESMPVLGDWDFNIRFLMRGDIGVIPESLANYHHRNTISDPADRYGNTVNAGIEVHRRYDAIIRNRYFRNGDMRQLGMLMNMGLVYNWQNEKFDCVNEHLARKTPEKHNETSTWNDFAQFARKVVNGNRVLRRIKEQIKSIGGEK